MILDPGASRLSRLAQRSRAGPAAAPPATIDRTERCELCNAMIGSDHRHLLDTVGRRLVCACRPCSLLFDDRQRASRKFLPIPDRVRRVSDFRMSSTVWDELAIPVDMAFFFLDTAANRIVALYPGAMGAAESQLRLGAWHDLEVENPVLASLEPDVEALLVNRTRDANEYWLVPIDVCYSLVGLIRTNWRGFSGGEEVWRELDLFFGGLVARGSDISRTDYNPKEIQRGQS